MDSEKNGLNDLTSIVSIAGGECHPAGTDGGATVLQPANRQLTGSVTRPDVTLANGERNNVTTKDCEQCGREYATKRPAQSRYCSGRCRQAAWSLRHPEQAAAKAAAWRARVRQRLEARGIAWQERQP